MDNLTLSETNYSNIAHIVAWERRGPRGDDPLPRTKRNDIENLMLVCTKHHKTIDSKENVNDYPKNKLQQFKKWHEDRIRDATDYKPESRTTVVRLKANVKDRLVQIPLAQIKRAIAPRYPTVTDCDIDLTNFPKGDSEHHWRTMTDAVTEKIRRLFEPGIEKESIEHISVFAIAPIPVLVHLGRRLSDKIETDVYQRHRSPEGWGWKKRGKKVQYKINKLREGRNATKVALILSLSGLIKINDLPDNINEDFTVYEIGLDGQQPTTLFLRTRDDLEEFKTVYHGFLGMLKENHDSVEGLHLFPAVPAPIAVMCGRERLAKVAPSLLVYDNELEKGGFKSVLEVK
jgi:hypothetical protein